MVSSAVSVFCNIAYIIRNTEGKKHHHLCHFIKKCFHMQGNKKHLLELCSDGPGSYWSCFWSQTVQLNNSTVSWSIWDCDSCLYRENIHSSGLVYWQDGLLTCFLSPSTSQSTGTLILYAGGHLEYVILHDLPIFSPTNGLDTLWEVPPGRPLIVC